MSFMIESLSVYVGRSSSVSKRVTVPLPGGNPSGQFTLPVVVATTLQDPRWPNPNIPDVFAVSIVSVSTTEFIAQIRRVDANSGWGQDLFLTYLAHRRCSEPG